VRLAPKLPGGLRSGLQHLYNRHLAPHDEARRLLVVGGGTTGLPGPLLAALHGHGFPVTLVSGRTAPAERAWVDRLVRADLSRPEAVLARVRAEHAVRPVAGVLTGERALVPLAARLAQALGLRSTLPEAASRAGSPERLAATLAAAGLGAAALERAPARGTEHSVVSLVAGDGVSHLALVDSERVAGAAEPLVHTTPSRLAPAAALAALELSARAALAVGLQGCAVHTRLRAAAGPAAAGPAAAGPAAADLAVADVAGVPAGDGLGLLVQLVRGVDLACAAGDAALGRLPRPAGGVAPAATLAFLVAARAHIQRGPLRERPPVAGLVDAVLRTGWGDEVRGGERVGHVLAVGRSPEESRATAERARQWVAMATGLELLPLGAG
jgi:hypothetical protein